MLAAPNLQKKNGLRDMAIMVLLYDSAMRVSELLGLTLSSLYLDAAIPYVRIHGASIAAHAPSGMVSLMGFVSFMNGTRDAPRAILCRDTSPSAAYHK